MRFSTPARRLFRVLRDLKRTYGPQHWWPARTKLEVIVGAILTQNAAWRNVEKAIAGLRKEGLLSYQALSRVSRQRLAGIIRPAGYFRLKARRLKSFVGYLERHYAGRLSRFLDEPPARLREKLLSIHGVGPETADSIALYAAGKPLFVVDAYTRRIFSRLGFLHEKAAYAEIQAFFMRNLPAEAKLFNEYHALIVEHAKNTCAPKPRCGRCVLRKQCDYAQQL